MEMFKALPIKITWSEKIQIDKDNLKDIPKEDCLYQAYGDSPIYGRDVLLYIGRTNDLSRRTKDHIKTDFDRINNLSICFGHIEGDCVDEDKDYSMDTLIKIAEALLITMLKPSYNSSNIKDTGELLKNENKYIILNCENRGVLPLEVTNIWWEQTPVI
jgi:excinuclease UvrABC nuclease subunit